ncbi:nucleolar and coiled-body phosphoprotein 1-like [Salvia splendens]|uniref:nucleolar and coiled-body phosphoprotein 1-like n=1 Tax=Salvia splendens TaxID=180675 RepID=UPI001C266627|nr:nucleolar and coiled-body phosphoprotein 1-like [Salvia splendens]
MECSSESGKGMITDATENNPLPPETSIPKKELKTLPPGLKYAYLEDNETFSVIVNSNLTKEQERDLLEIQVMESTSKAGNPTTSADFDAAAFMSDLVQKFRSAEEAMKAFTLFTTMMEIPNPTALATTTTTAPPPSTIPVDSTAQPSILHTEAEPTISAPEKDAAVGEEKEDEADLAAGFEQMVVGDQRLARVVEGETPGFSTNVGCEGIAEGETPEKFVGSEALGVDLLVAEGETPVYIEGETLGLSEGEEAPVTEDVSVLKGSGLQLMVDLVEISEATNSPVDKREARLRARRSLRDEIEDLTLPTEEKCLAPGTEGGQGEKIPGSSKKEDEAEERRLAEERKRKGKHAATSRIKKSKQNTAGKSAEAPLPAPTKVPFAKERVGPTPSSESEEEEMDEQDEELNFEPAEVWLTKGLLEAMGKFEDPKRAATYKERCGSGKLAKSEKRYDREELREMDSDEEFRQYIGAIGFDWLLKHSDAEVPIALAREFFSTFCLRTTTDLDADSITF